MNKKNLILALILIILIAAAYLYNGPWQKWQDKKSQPKNIFASLNIDGVNKIEIMQAGESTILSADGSKWKIEGTKNFYADNDRINTAVNALKELVNGDLELVSTNKDKKADFQTDNSGIKLTLYIDNNKASEIIIGKIGSDYQSTYVSKSDTDKTYLTKAQLNIIFSYGDWYDKTIFASDKEKINKVRFQIGNYEFSAEKKDEEWLADNNAKLNNDKVGKVLDIMSNLQAIEIPEQDFSKAGLDKSEIIVQAAGDGVDNILMVGDDNGEGLYYAKKGDSDNIYLITKEQGDELKKQIKDLR